MTAYEQSARILDAAAAGGRVPGYEEIVRDDRYLERVSETLGAWSSGLCA